MQKIRKKRLSKFNQYWYYWAVFALIFFTVVNYFSRNIKLDLDLGLIVSVTTFLFGFLISISFSMLIYRVTTLKENLAMETGRLVNLYLLSKHFGERFFARTRERIDAYTMLTLRDYKNYEVGREIAYGMFDDLKYAEMKTEAQKRLIASYVNNLSEFETVREKLEYLTSVGLEKALKFTSYILGVILIVLLFLDRGSLFTNIIFVVMSTIIVFLFLIIEDYDDLLIEDYSSNISNSEQLFDLIGKERFYPVEILDKVKLEKGKKYRVGMHDKAGKDRIVMRTC
jgi:hypothetical protein